MKYLEDKELYENNSFDEVEDPTTNEEWLAVGFASDPGKSGKPNQDYYGIIEATYTLGQQAVAETPIIIGVIADGISTPGGDIAGQIAVETIRHVLIENPSIPIKPRLDAAIRRANKEVFQVAQDVPQYVEAGATIVAAAFAADQLYVAHLGDSRAYLVRDRKMHLLTVDHRWGQEAVDAGEMTPEEAMAYPDRNVITRLLGSSKKIEVDHQIVDIEIESLDPDRIQRWPLVDRMWMQPGDTILLCSDGLSDVLTAQQIEAVINRYSPQSAAQRLIEMVNAAGGPDNVTVLIFKLPAPHSYSAAWTDSGEPSATAQSKPNYLLRSITVLLLLVGIISGGWLITKQWFSSQEQSNSGELIASVQRTNPEGSASASLPTTAVGETPAVKTPIAQAPTGQTSKTEKSPVAIQSTEKQVTTTLAAETPITATFVSITLISGTVATTPTVTATVATSTVMIAEIMTAEIITATDVTPTIPATQSLTIVQPQADATISGVQRFEWRDNADLADDESYEIVVWKVGTERTAARSIAGLSHDTYRIINLSSSGLEAGNYHWGVRIVRLEDGTEIAYLGADAQFTYAP